MRGQVGRWAARPGKGNQPESGIVGLVDIHAHLLPGIDDGPDDLEEALAMARAAAGAGTSTLVATPHLRSDFPGVDVLELAERCETLRAAIGDAAIPIDLVGGAEVSLAWALGASEQELVLASYGQRGSDLLLEAPPGTTPLLEGILRELRRRGYRVILAHPERSLPFQRNRGRLRGLVEQGALLQINADSLLTRNPLSGTRRLAQWLCQEGLAHAIASDGHRSSSWRPVGQLADGVDAVTGLIGAARARWMAEDAPGAIVGGLELPEGPPPIW